MTPPPIRPLGRNQSGVALFLFLVLLILAGSYAFYRTANVSAMRNDRNAAQQSSLARAKEALIARAVADLDRPGSLPCPDLITNLPGNNIPGDGKADLFSMNQCPSYVGWLPWITLDLPELVDDSSTRLWYVLAPQLRDDDGAQPINSNTALGMSVDGVSDSVAALIIAPGAALAGQNRPSNNPADYLEGENGNGNDHIFVTGPQSATFNDQMVIITRQELMAAVEKRVANELKTCLAQHAADNLNTAHTYTWPALLSDTGYRGSAGALFGLVPDTQPGSGAESQLKASTSALNDAKTALATASTATDQMTALLVVSRAATYALTLYDKLYGIASALAVVAQSANDEFDGLDAIITAAVANGRISRTERTALRAEAIDVKTSLTAFQTALDDYGIDPFPIEVQIRNLALQQKISAATTSATAANLTALQAASLSQLEIYSLSSTPNPDLSLALTTAASAAAVAANAAQTAASTPTDSALVANALLTARSLLTANDALLASITASRVNLHASEFTVHADALVELLAAYDQAPGSTSASAINTQLQALNTTLNGLSTSSSPVVTARANLQSVLTAALTASATGIDIGLIHTSTAQVITASSQLADAIANNGDQILKESLAVAASAYVGAQTTFNTVTTRTQAQMVPYVRAMQTPAQAIAFWAEITVRAATNIATQARRSPGATTDNSSSAYTLANQLSTGITDSGGTQALLQAYLNSPTNANQTAATDALNTTLSQLQSLLDSASSLDALLDSGTANALPTVWYGSTCAFLQPTTGNNTWWTANQWKTLTLFQVTKRIHPAYNAATKTFDSSAGCVGTLTVNGSGTHCVVTLSAGRALTGQNRSSRVTSNFLENLNASTSRDGTAKTPSTAFANDVPSSTFNDRIAF